MRVCERERARIRASAREEERVEAGSGRTRGGLTAHVVEREYAVLVVVVAGTVLKSVKTLVDVESGVGASSSTVERGVSSVEKLVSVAVELGASAVETSVKMGVAPSTYCVSVMVIEGAGSVKVTVVVEATPSTVCVSSMTTLAGSSVSVRVIVVIGPGVVAVSCERERGKSSWEGQLEVQGGTRRE